MNLAEDYESSEDEDYVPSEHNSDDDAELNLKLNPDEEVCVEDAQQETSKPSEEENLNSDDEKKRIESLWNDFLGGSESSNDALKKTKPSETSNSVSVQNCIKSNETKTESTSLFSTEKNEASSSFVFPDEHEKTCSETVVEVYDFAGEEVRVEKTRPKRLIPTVKSGLANAVSTITTKKKKMTVLDKTDYDWKNYVKEKGIAEDLNNHSKSKDAYLDKQEFLLKTDFNQFEKEKSLRSVQRK